MKLLFAFRKAWFLLGPLCFSWLLFWEKQWKCVYVILVVSSFWVLDVLPLGITSLLPIFFFPLFEILPAGEVSRTYFQDSSALFMFSLIMALAVEQSGLHRRLALKMLSICGPRRNCVLLTLASATGFMSCFLSDTASTALSLPIAIAIIEALQTVRETITATKSWSRESTSSTNDTFLGDESTVGKRLDEECENMNEEDKNFSRALLLVCAQSAMIGGTGIITGCAPNMMFRDQMKQMYGNEKKELSYVAWMSFSLPFIPLYLLANCMVVIVMCMGYSSLFCQKQKNLSEKEAKERKEMNSHMAQVIREQYHRLGSISFAEYSVIFWFSVLMAAWISRKPGFVTGWGALLDKKNYVADSTVAVLVCSILFIWPKSLRGETQFEPILDWQNMKNHFPWAVLLFVGSGSAISEGVRVSGLADYLSCLLATTLSDFSPFWLQVLAVTITLLVVEVMGNVPTAGVVIPIILAISRSLGVDPLYIGLPCTLAVSYTFVLPHACASNTIIKETRLVSQCYFLKTGSLLKVFCLLITVFNFNTYGKWVLKIDNSNGGGNSTALNVNCSMIK